MTTEGYKRHKIIKVPNIIRTIDQILEDLNGKGKSGPWIRMPNYYALSESEITSNQIKMINRSLALIGFFNTEKAEVKFYVAKFIEDEASKKLT